MGLDEIDSLLAEQIAYYRARAHEYDTTHAVDAASRASNARGVSKDTAGIQKRLIGFGRGITESETEINEAQTENTEESVSNPRQDEKFALHGCLEHSTALPRVRRPTHNDLRQILPSQFPKEFSNSSISSGSGEVGLNSPHNEGNAGCTNRQRRSQFSV